MANTSIKNAFERMWQHTVSRIGEVEENASKCLIVNTTKSVDDNLYTTDTTVSEINNVINNGWDVRVHDNTTDMYYHITYSDVSYAIFSGIEFTSVGGVKTVVYLLTNNNKMSKREFKILEPLTKGVDYWTEEDKREIIAEVVDSIKVQYPETHVIYGDVDENKNITIYGELAEGVYTLKYENEDGTTIDVGTIEIDNDDSEDGSDENNPTAKYINQIPISTDTDGSIYNGIGYKTGTRGNSSGVPVALLNPSAEKAPFFTGFIPCKQGDVIRLKNCYIFAHGGNGSSKHGTLYGGEDAFGLRCGLYNASKTKISVESWGNLRNNIVTEFSNYTILNPDSTGDGKIMEFTIARSGTSYVRLTLATDGDPADAIVTVNEEID